MLSWQGSTRQERPWELILELVGMRKGQASSLMLGSCGFWDQAAAARQASGSQADSSPSPTRTSRPRPLPSLTHPVPCQCQHLRLCYSTSFLCLSAQHQLCSSSVNACGLNKHSLCECHLCYFCRIKLTLNAYYIHCIVAE